MGRKSLFLTDRLFSVPMVEENRRFQPEILVILCISADFLVKLYISDDTKRVKIW